uniref:Uncharacterized protein n=1 Tax=Chromera velia CCMP2878 TaxID=1169474 RepID=A0A0G4G8Q8_9ALVE|eukprot:Cvel_4350.t1-p1 / transcript=Cvel_4350.t1 / gene=Cvel_4350 / organism=Chromera_velia_CCMP2878 / gene_product=hypothetical protein / transcript_product=hypothetical protein / location=Cvel_scaffold188:98943-104799(-) / protein_length=1034 / sequence_SO=supercontig / SO=protein_coding / is_pseudo=false
MSVEKSARVETEGEVLPSASNQDGQGDGLSAGLEAERRDNQGRDDSLSAFLPWMRATSEANWNKALGKVPVAPPRSIDLSGTRDLSSENIFLFLDFLPPSVEEMKLDSVGVKGRALPLLLRFLERLQAAREDGVQALRLKQFTFAGALIRPEEASKVFPVLLPSLEILSLKDNPLGPEGIGAVAEGVREGKAASLRVLNLERTGLEKRGMKSLSEAMKEKSLCKMEILNVSGNKVGGVEEMEGLGSVLCLSSLPPLRDLLLRDCGLTDEAVKPLAESMGRGDLMNLEVLDLGGNSCRGGFLGDLGGALRADVVRHLRELNVTDARGSEAVGNKEPVTSFLSALGAPECPPNLQVRGLRLTDGDLSEEEVRAVGASKYQPLRTLDLSLPSAQVTPFLEEVVGAEEAPTYEVLDLRLHFLNAANEGLSLVGEAIQSGRFACVRKLWVGDLRDPDGAADPTDFVGGKTALFTSFSQTRLPLLSEFLMHRFLLTDADMTRFAEAVRVGNLSGLRVLEMRSTGGEEDEGFGQEGMDALTIALVESEEGLPFLNKLDLRDTKAGGAAESWGRVFASGKLPCLSDINLSNSLLTGQTLRRFGDAVREGGLVGVSSLDLSRNGSIGRGAWGEFMRAVAESKRGMPKLKNLDLHGTGVEFIGGKVALTFASGRLPSLEGLGVGSFFLDSEGLGDLGEAVRRGGWPPQLCNIHFIIGFSLTEPNCDLDELFRAIGESERGLPPCVAQLTINGGRLSEEALAFLATNGGGAGEGRLSHLKYLEVSCSGIDNARLRRLAEVFSSHECRELEHVNLRDNNQITAAGVSAFLEGIAHSERGMSKLKSLDCLGTKCVELIGGKVALAFASGRLPSLEGLGVRSFSLDSEGLGDLGEAVRRGGWPFHFHIIGFSLTEPNCDLDRLFRAIGESERGLPPCVASLILSRGRLSEEALASLAACGGGASGGKLSHLKYLDLSSCGIDDAMLKRLGEVFSAHACRELERVNLQNNHTTAAGVSVSVFLEVIAQSGGGMSKLKSLDLQGTGVELT